MWRRSVLVVAAAVILAAGFATSSPSRPELAPLVEAVVRGGAPGALVLVDDGGDDVRTAAAGVTALDGGGRLRAGTRFRIGSVTKLFTAALVLQLVDERRLGLDDPVERRLPGLLPRQITVRDLLSHRSGLYDHADLPAVLRESDRAWTPRELVAASLAQGLGPRGRFAYSSTNYVVLGMVLQRVTGRQYAALLDQRIARPLGLRATSYVAAGRIAGPHVHGHAAASHDGFLRPVRAADDTDAASPSWGGAAAAIVSDARDVARFLRALLAGKVVPRRLLDEMRPAMPARRNARAYGLGLGARRMGCGAGVVGHTGNFLGTVTVAYARGDRVVVAMMNAHPPAAEADAAFQRLIDEVVC